METKVCSCCKVEKPVSEFSKSKAKKDGLRIVCRACDRDYYQRNKERIAVRDKKYRQQNKDIMRTRNKNYYDANKTTLALKLKEYRQQNKSVIAAQRKEHYETNKTNLLVIKKAYYHANKEERRVYARNYLRQNRTDVYARNANRRAARIKATPTWADVERIKEFYDCCRAFRMYTGLEYHVDHIVPLNSKLVCGLHCEANLQVLEASENISKNNRYWPDMPQ